MQGPDPTTVAEALARVYARAEFRERRPPSFLERIWDQIATAFVEALEWLAERIPFPDPGTQNLIAWVAVVLVAAAVFLVVVRLRARRSPGKGRPGTATSLAPAPMRSAEGWERAAAEAASAGRYRDAALALYRAVLLRLAGRGALHLREGKTPGDYQRELAGRDRLEEGFRGFIRLLLPLAWGSGRATPEAWADLEDAARRLDIHERSA